MQNQVNEIQSRAGNIKFLGIVDKKKRKIMDKKFEELKTELFNWGYDYIEEHH